MKLFLLKAVEGDEHFNPWYDKSFAHVVRAKNEKEARGFAAKQSGDEGSQVWLDDKSTSCEVLTAKGKEGSIITDTRMA